MYVDSSVLYSDCMYNALTVVLPYRKLIWRKNDKKRNLPLSLVNPPNMTREISAQLSILNLGTRGQDLVHIRHQISHFIDQVSTEGNEERQSFSIRLVLMITQLYFSQNKLWISKFSAIFVFNLNTGISRVLRINLHKQILDTWLKQIRTVDCLGVVYNLWLKQQWQYRLVLGM